MKLSQHPKPFLCILCLIFPLVVQAQYREPEHRNIPEGAGTDVVDKMQTRSDLYELIHYEDYNAFDQSIFNFKL